MVYGSGAALAHPGDVLVYADLPRWEIQQRMRHDGLGNWGAKNQDEDILRRYKRAFFIEWRVFDKHKTPLLKRADYLLDTTVKNSPAMVSATRYAPVCNKPPNNRFALSLSLTLASGAGNG